MTSQDEMLLRVHVVTWNMNSRLPNYGLPKSLFRNPKSGQAERCLYAIGVQEASQVNVWVGLLQKELGENFLLIGEGNIGGIHLVLFVTTDIVQDHKFDITTDIVSCGLGNIYWNKGAVGFLLTINTQKFLFINCHLAAQQDKVSDRNQDYHRISRELFKSKNAPGASIESLADVIFWFGDFNYRIEGNRRSVDYLLRKRMMHVLQANDQLLIERQEKRTFLDFLEGDIHFLPTYKFDNGTDKYDTSAKKRVPSWTDRILWKVCNQDADVEVVLWLYDSVRELKSSDHKPVIGIFDVHMNLNGKPHTKSLDASRGPSLDASLNPSHAASLDASLAGSRDTSVSGSPETRQNGVPQSSEPRFSDDEIETEEEDSEEDDIQNEEEIEQAKAMLKEPLKNEVTNVSILEAPSAIDELFVSFSTKINSAFDLCDQAHRKKEQAILKRMKEVKRKVAHVRKAAEKAEKATEEAEKATEEAEKAKEKAEKAKEKAQSVSANGTADIKSRKQLDEKKKQKEEKEKEKEKEKESDLYKKISELRTELYQEKRAHMQTKAKVEIMNRKANKNKDDEGGLARRKSSVSSISTAKVAIAAARMRKKQSQIYG